jgi:hypothetical protein
MECYGYESNRKILIGCGAK